MDKKGFVFSVGVNDSPTAVQRFKCWREAGVKKCKLLWACPFYNKWKGMLERCYSDKFKVKQPSYEGCYVCEEWLKFSNFKNWMIQQDYEGKHLDKDLLVEGNRMYSPETCIFIPRKINNFLILRGNDRGEFPLGVSYDNNAGKFKAAGQENGYRKHLGLFCTPTAAHKAWQEHKLKLVRLLIDEEEDTLVIKGLQRISLKLEEDLRNKKETLTL